MKGPRGPFKGPRDRGRLQMRQPLYPHCHIIKNSLHDVDKSTSISAQKNSCNDRPATTSVASKQKAKLLSAEGEDFEIDSAIRGKRGAPRRRPASARTAPALCVQGNAWKRMVVFFMKTAEGNARKRMVAPDQDAPDTPEDGAPAARPPWVNSRQLVK